MSDTITSNVWPCLDQRERLVAGADRGHVVAGGLHHRHEHVAEEGRVVDEQQGARQRVLAHFLAAEPVLEGERQEVADVDDLGRLALDDRGAEDARHVAADLDVEPVLDDVDDLVDHEAHRASGIGEHQQRLRAFGAHAHVVADADQRHELAAVLHQMAAVGELDLLAVDLFEPRDQRQRHRLGLLRTGAEHEERDGLLDLAGLLRLVGISVACVPAEPTVCAMPFGSMIMITEPSPRMVLPENIAM